MHIDQEKKYEPHFIEVQCANCGEKFITDLHRFPICKCFHTKPLFKDSPYAVYKNGIIDIYQGDQKETYSIIDADALIKKLPGIWFLPEQDTIKQLEAQKIPHVDVLKNPSSAEIILHSIYMTQSDLYRDVVKLGFTDLAKQMINSGEIRKYKDKEEVRNMIGISAYLNNSDNLLISLECCLRGIGVECAKVLAQASITPDMYELILSETNYPKDVIMDYIVQFGSVMVFGEETVEKIIKFYKYTKELNQIENTSYLSESSSDHIYVAYAMAELRYTTLYRAGMLSYHDYCRRFNFLNKFVPVNDKYVKLLNSKDMQDLKVGSLPCEKVDDEPVVAVYDKDKNLLAVCCNIKGRVFYRGNRSDDVKQTFNTFFDMMIAMKENNQNESNNGGN